MPWHEKEFGALFTMESNEVLFDFQVKDIKLTGRVTRVRIDPRFGYVCEKETLSVLGAPNPDKPAHVAAYVDHHNGILTIEIARSWWRCKLFGDKLLESDPTKVSLRLTGIRRGFLDWDMPERSRRQFEANEAHLNSIYPPE